MKKTVFYSEAAYLIGLILIAFGVVLAEKADFGVSMIVAPAYLLYRLLNPAASFFTFGMAEYCFQAVLLLCMILIIRRFRLSYLLSFVTAVLYGLILDGGMLLGTLLPDGNLRLRVLYYAIGLLLSASGVSLIFHTYLSPEVYELFVKEVAARYSLPLNRFKSAYDIGSCLLAVLMSFAFFGLWHFVGIGIGTVVCTLLNGVLIGGFSKLFDRFFTFRDLWKARPFFTGEEPLR